MSKFTRKGIIDSFMDLLKRKSLDKISVKDVIESAEVNRSTFYYYFDSIFSLLDAVFEDAIVEFEKETQKGGSFYEEYVRAASILLDNKRAVIHIYYSNSKDILQKYLMTTSMLFVERFVRKAAEGYKISDEGIRFITNFYSYAIAGKTMHWIENGMKDYSNNLLLMISNSFEATVNDMIIEYIKNQK